MLLTNINAILTGSHLPIEEKALALAWLYEA